MVEEVSYGYSHSQSAGSSMLFCNVFNATKGQGVDS